MELAVQAEALSKVYRLYARPFDRALEWLTLGRTRRHVEHWALSDVSFSLPRGGALGVCGSNGAGKSTLLKLLSGTTHPTRGRFRLSGRVASLIELGAGFHLEFTGRENVAQQGALLGATRREIAKRMGAILDFAEIGGAVDEPVRTYSSGMAMRLGFAAAIGFEPELLILDEVVAVGDMYFQKKCVDRLFEFRRGGGTTLLCSHSLYDLRQICDAGVWLDGGRVARAGGVVEVTNAYAAFQREHIARANRVDADGATSTPRGADWPAIESARVVRAGSDAPVAEVASGDSIEVRVAWRNPRPDLHPIHVGIAFQRQDQTLAAGMGTHFDGVALGGESGTLVLECPRLALLSGTFQVRVYLFDGHGVHRYQELALDDDLVVRSDTREVGLVRLEHRFRVEPARVSRVA